MAALTSTGSGPAEWDAFSTTAVCYALAHRSAAHPANGTISVGAWLRRCGGTNGYGPKNPAVARSMDAILTAATYPDLHRAITAAFRSPNAAVSAPDWARLACDITQWQASPATRDATRLAWAHDFHTYTPRTDNDPAPAAETETTS